MTLIQLLALVVIIILALYLWRGIALKEPARSIALAFIVVIAIVVLLNLSGLTHIRM